MSIKKLLLLSDSWGVVVPESVVSLRDRLSETIKPRQMLEWKLTLGYAGTVSDSDFIIRRLAESSFRPRPTIFVTGHIESAGHSKTDVAITLRSSNYLRFLTWLLLFIAVVAPLGALADQMPGSPDPTPAPAAAVVIPTMFAVWLFFALIGYLELSLIRREITALVAGERR